MLKFAQTNLVIIIISIIIEEWWNYKKHDDQ